MTSQHTLPPWAPQGANNKKPPATMISDGFRSTTVGDNGWLNYIINQITSHCQIPVGVIMESMESTYPGGVLCDGTTIGSVASTAVNKDDSYQALFILLWDNFPVLPSKGATAIADWGANKAVTLPNLEGKVCVGKNTTGVFNSPLGTYVGSETAALTEAQLPTTTVTLNDPGHTHDFISWRDTGVTRALGSSDVAITLTNIPTDSGTTGITMNPFGGGEAHANVQPSSITNFFIKY